MAIAIPGLSRATKYARNIKAANNQRNIVTAATLYASDNNDRYPESVAASRVIDSRWGWLEPTILVSRSPGGTGHKRSVSAYLYDYNKEPSVMFCPNAPVEYKYLDYAWVDGDNWDNPEVESYPLPGSDCASDPLNGTYSFYWNYEAIICKTDADGQFTGETKLFKGPKRVGGRKDESTVLVSDYFGYNHSRSKGVFAGCEPFGSTIVVNTSALSSHFWAGTVDSQMPNVKLRAGYTDGHVDTFTPQTSESMFVKYRSETNEIYPTNLPSSPGEFFIPKNSIR